MSEEHEVLDLNEAIGRKRNITAVAQSVTLDERLAGNGHESGVLWFTGLSGSGKSTLAMALQRKLFELGGQVFVLDGDNVRHGLNKDLGFSPEDRAENIRRVAEVARLFADAGNIVLVTLISPTRQDRAKARDVIGERFHEIYIKADVEACVERDPKGLYKRAIAGEIPEFTGISAPYEAPEAPELVINTVAGEIEDSLAELLNYTRAALFDEARAQAAL